MSAGNLHTPGLLVPGPNFEAVAPTVIEPIGAVAQWRAELRAGVGGQELLKPSTWLRDALWSAACYETAALDCARAGIAVGAHSCLQHAAEAIRRVQQERQDAQQRAQCAS